MKFYEVFNNYVYPYYFFDIFHLRYLPFRPLNIIGNFLIFYLQLNYKELHTLQLHSFFQYNSKLKPVVKHLLLQM